MWLSSSELRSRASAFVAAHAGDGDEMRDTHSFYNDFFERIFGVPRKRVGIYEKSVEKLSGGRGRIDLFWPGTLVVEQKSAGRDLGRARLQALDYIHALKDDEKPRYLLLSDRSFELVDFETGEEVAFLLAELPRHIEKFAFILGRQTRRFKDQDPVNIRAAELVGKLHDLLAASGYTGHRLEVFLTRLVFCLFADDTGIFQPRDILFDWLENETRPDGRDLGQHLNELFAILDTPEDQRQTTLDPALQRFPYVNGQLFSEYFPAPAFDAEMRAALLNACRFDWTPISPAIFGSLFQSVMEAAERRAKGAHYTTEQNILKLIGPLFLDDLRAEFAAICQRRTGRHQALERFRDRLAGLTFFDPACGCGNFLIIAYRELRLLEIAVLRELYPDGQLALDAKALSRVDVDQFFGIEIAEFPARIAATALWMMDHLMNLRLSEAFGGYWPRIPLRKAPTIIHGDALELDWAAVLPPEDCSHVLGNPPFVGAKMQSEGQRAQVRAIAGLGKSGGTLDFVAAWFIKAGEYAGRAVAAGGKAPRIAFVSTNSITQGEQVAQLWPILFDRHGLEISFAHRTFEWGSDARGKAHVHCVIIGLDHAAQVPERRRLFFYPSVKGDPVESTHRALSPYLFDASGLGNPHTVVREEARPINGMRRLKTGVQMIDNGILTFTNSEKNQFCAIEPDAEKYFRRYLGGDEYINGFSRWILYLRGADPSEIKTLRHVTAKVSAVREYRAQSDRTATKQMADYPTLLGVDERLANPFLVIPNTSSERRDYIPIGWLLPDVVANQKLRILPDATLSEFALLTSTMHLAWMRAVTGRMKSDYMYSVGVVYNTFPLPPAADLSKLDPLAQAVLDARAAHPGATLADLYDPDLMPPNLRAAHGALDRAVDRLYRPAGFASDRERVEHLFALYERMAAPLLAAPAGKRKARARPA